MFEYVYDVPPYQIAVLRYLTVFKQKAKRNICTVAIQQVPKASLPLYKFARLPCCCY